MLLSPIGPSINHYSSSLSLKYSVFMLLSLSSVLTLPHPHPHPHPLPVVRLSYAVATTYRHYNQGSLPLPRHIILPARPP